METPAIPVPDETYYIQGNFLTFLVETSIFRLPSYPFIEGSDAFRTILQLPQGGQYVLEGYSDGTPIHLSRVTAVDFKNFLLVLCPRGYPYPQPTTKEQWSSILRLASLWMFDAIRDVAVKRLDSLLQQDSEAVDCILLGREFQQTEWLIRGYSALITREQTPTDAEAETIGWKCAAQIFRSREQHILSHQKQNVVVHDVECSKGHRNSSLECLQCHDRFALKTLVEGWTEKPVNAGRVNEPLQGHLRTVFADELRAMVSS